MWPGYTDACLRATPYHGLGARVEKRIGQTEFGPLRAFVLVKKTENVVKYVFQVVVNPKKVNQGDGSRQLAGFCPRQNCQVELLKMLISSLTTVRKSGCTGASAGRQFSGSGKSNRLRLTAWVSW